MPRGVRKNKVVSMLQANDPSAYKVEQPEIVGLTEEQIREAAAPYLERGVKLDITPTHWFLTLKKSVYDVKGRLIGSGDVKVCGTRQMPIKDFDFSARELMIPITPPGMKE